MEKNEKKMEEKREWNSNKIFASSNLNLSIFSYYFLITNNVVNIQIDNSLLFINILFFNFL